MSRMKNNCNGNRHFLNKLKYFYAEKSDRAINLAEWKTCLSDSLFLSLNRSLKLTCVAMVIEKLYPNKSKESCLVQIKSKVNRLIKALYSYTLL